MDRFQIVVNFVCFDTQPVREGYKRFYARFFLLEFGVSFGRNKSDFATFRRQPQIGIVLPQQDPVLGPRGEHPVGFVHPLRYEVVDQHADIGFVAPQDDRRLAAQLPVGVDARHEPLCRGLLVTRRAVDLSGEEKTPHGLRFERMVQLRGRKIVVFDGIARAVDLQMLETADAVQRLPLHFPGQRRREAVQVVFVCRAALGFEEELVLLLAGEGAQLVLDRGTVTGSDAVDRAVEERRAVKTAAQDLVHLGRRVDQVARKLVFDGLRLRREGEFRGVFIAVLGFEQREVDRPRIEARRGAGFHAAAFETHALQALGDAVRGGIAGTAPFGMGLAAVHQSVEEGAGREHHGAAGELHPHAGADSADAGLPLPGLLEEELRGGILPDREVRRLFERPAPALRKARLVALRPRAPHRRTLRAVEHAELHGREVRDAARLASHGIYLPDYLAFGNAADGRVARHRGHFRHVHRQQQRARPEACGGRGGLTAGVSAADDDNIVFELHVVCFLSMVMWFGAPVRRAAAFGGLYARCGCRSSAAVSSGCRSGIRREAAAPWCCPVRFPAARFSAADYGLLLRPSAARLRITPFRAVQAFFAGLAELPSGDGSEGL